MASQSVNCGISFKSFCLNVCGPLRLLLGCSFPLPLPFDLRPRTCWKLERMGPIEGPRSGTRHDERIPRAVVGRTEPKDDMAGNR